MTGGSLICVVDDDKSVCKALVGLITSMGYRSIGFASAEEALGSVHIKAADCIITDIHMPGLDGFAFKRRLDERNSSAAVIMMTSRSEGTLDLRVKECGAICLIRKPLRAELLAQHLSRALGKTAD